MSIPGWQTFIRDKAQEQKVKWTRHALNALGAETVSVGDVEIALQQVEIIELYTLRHRYLPDCLVQGFVSNLPIHCVVANEQAPRLHPDCDGVRTNRERVAQ